MFGGGSYSNAYEERARLKKKKNKAKAAAAASAAKSKPSVKKYPFAVRLNEEQLDNHLGRVLKLFANKGNFQQLSLSFPINMTVNHPFCFVRDPFWTMKSLHDCKMLTSQRRLRS